MIRTRGVALMGFLAGCLGGRVASAEAGGAQSEATSERAPALASASVEPQGIDGSPVPESPTAVPREAPAQPPSLEVWGTVGPSVVFGEPANPQYAGSFRRVGGFGELGIAYRSSYFVDPFLSVAYANLANGESHLPSGTWGEGGTLDQYLSTWVISPGVTSDIWRFRVRVGLGIAVVTQSFRYLGQKDSSTQLPLAHQFGLGFNMLSVHRFRLDAETRLVLAPGADVTFASLAVVARGDLIQFGAP